MIYLVNPKEVVLNWDKLIPPPPAQTSLDVLSTGHVNRIKSIWKYDFELVNNINYMHYMIHRPCQLKKNLSENMILNWWINGRIGDNQSTSTSVRPAHYRSLPLTKPPLDIQIPAWRNTVRSFGEIQLTIFEKYRKQRNPKNHYRRLPLRKPPLDIQIPAWLPFQIT